VDQILTLEGYEVGEAETGKEALAALTFGVQERRGFITLVGEVGTGKTTLLLKLQSRLAQEGKSVRYLNCDLEEERQAANTTSKTLLDRLVAGKDAILIDEVQRLDNPGLTLKILVDLYPALMILVTGPTGSGKTTTLYSALSDLNKVSDNISTAEDPIEYDLPLKKQRQIPLSELATTSTAVGPP
jgi:Tfp pilus assembly pilus retraction ATPase PilT